MEGSRREDAGRSLSGNVHAIGAVAFVSAIAQVVPIRKTVVIEGADERALAAIATHLRAGGIVVLVPPATEEPQRS
jgi:hypothetical protein